MYIVDELNFISARKTSMTSLDKAFVDTPYCQGGGAKVRDNEHGNKSKGSIVSGS